MQQKYNEDFARVQFLNQVAINILLVVNANTFIYWLCNKDIWHDKNIIKVIHTRIMIAIDLSLIILKTGKLHILN